MDANEQRGVPITGLLESEPLDSIYANTTDLQWTLTDVTVRFGEVVQRVVANASEAKIREKAVVTIPWWQAKLLRDMLSDLISRYENLNGELKRANLP